MAKIVEEELLLIILVKSGIQLNAQKCVIIVFQTSKVPGLWFLNFFALYFLIKICFKKWKRVPAMELVWGIEDV